MKNTARRALALIMAGMTALAGAVVFNATARSRTSAAQAANKFEVASIRPGSTAPRGGRGGGGCAGGLGQVEPNRFAITNATLYNLITLAYGIDCLNVSVHDLISGGPGWIASDLFTVQAIIPEGSPRYTINQLGRGQAPALQTMLQSMLTERFKLAVHRETKELPVYALTVAPSGAKLQPSHEGSCVKRDPSNPVFEPPPRGVFVCGTGGVAARGPNVFVATAGITLDFFATRLDLVLDRPVVNKTGITGLFDIRVDFAPEGTTIPPFQNSVVGVAEAPSIFTAIQQQLGLRLEATKGPVEVLVIDSVQKPSEN
jgi:uncharacterized protein (TIGR03435 family)